MTTLDLVILVSGHVGAGKTTLARMLVEKLDQASVISSRDVLATQLGGRTAERGALQLLGEELDRQTRGRWLRDAIEDTSASKILIVDAVRTSNQIEQLRTVAHGSLHIHLKATMATLRQRYEARRSQAPETELPSYDQVLANSTESRVSTLGGEADLCIDTSFWSPSKTTDLAESAVHLL